MRTFKQTFTVIGANETKLGTIHTNTRHTPYKNHDQHVLTLAGEMYGVALVARVELSNTEER